MIDVDALQSEALNAVESTDSLAALDEVRVAWLGKKGKITEQLKTLGQSTPEERKTLGATLNKAKNAINEAVEGRKAALNRVEIDTRLASETVDVTLPARDELKGAIHPISQVMREVADIFAQFGFTVAEGPDIEDDWHNFTALNIPENHPARQMQDTFYLNGEDDKGAPHVLRTHTSPVQIRTMTSQEPPIRIIAPGSTYRCDSDLTHTPMFHQVEGLVIDKEINFSHLKGILKQFLETFFEISDVPMRFRPSFFPFTEPSAEVDIGCARGKDGLVIGGGKDWLEILGCGMVHPNVLRNCGLDPEEWQGFAFGMGIERMAMLKYNIPDLRTFFDSDVRWLNHYGFGA